MGRRGRWLGLLLAAWGLLPGSARGQPPENLLRNPGFEAVADGQLRDWSAPPYWSGSIAPADAARSGKQAARLTAAEKQGRHWGRALQIPRVAGLAGIKRRAGWLLSVCRKDAGHGEKTEGNISCPDRFIQNVFYRSVRSDGCRRMAVAQIARA